MAVTHANGPDLSQVAIEAYTFLYPLVNMDVFRRQMTNIEPGQRPGFGPLNTINHMRAFHRGLKVVARPNFDTLYSSVWLDLTAEPVIVSAPTPAGGCICCRCWTCGPTHSRCRAAGPAGRRQATSGWCRPGGGGTCRPA